MNQTPHNDELNIIDDLEHDTLPVAGDDAHPWRILIVDDDPEVHNATVFALQDIRIDGRPLLFIHAHSGSEAQAAIEQDEDIAVVILDVVMEHESAGLDLVRIIRHELGRSAIRIILRTGQPGYAPEMRVIREYDINDYKTKSELTRVRLLTTLTTAVRSYDQLRTIMIGRQGLSKIVTAGADLFSCRSSKDFAERAVSYAMSFAEHATGAFLCVRSNGFNGRQATPLVVSGGAGSYAARNAQPVAECPAAAAMIEQTLQEARHSFSETASAFFISGSEGRHAVLYLETTGALPTAARQLLEVFCTNIGVGLENTRLIADLQFSAYTDRLTRLPNRLGFVAKIDERLSGDCESWTMALIDIDDFSELNDALGHQKGDQLLLAVAQRLGSIVTPPMVLARTAGDVFGLLGPDAMLDPAALLALFKTPFAVGEYSLPIKASLGLKRLGQSEDSGIDLLKATNIALNRAKLDQRGRWQYYTTDMAEATRSRLDLLHELRMAVTHQRGLELHYQPQLELEGGRVIGAEALVRWRNNEGQLIRPDQFISLAEYSGLIIELGEWVFRTAAHQLQNWQRAGLPGLRVGINISLVQFRDPQFLSRIRRAVTETGIDPRQIELEITESVAMLEADTVIATLHELKQMGMQIAVDDFGTGFSSLAYLHRLPIDRLKIDRAFIRDMASQAKAGAGGTIAETIVRLGDTLGLSVIAEGVEEETQAEALRGFGCQLAQGFLYSRPLPAEDFEHWYRQRQ